ncbi:hypothetical protein EGR_03719 [Echinococcus granulosus]|uniref:Uncharacterized protein n=1 Tax=Echinococcus granulosus TaxID=6210 RepID=W6V586_ECHGR|nr:hypothetical protein EGR_03719 [Echinococcus granulosus]EUB61429.1 hypothetical protein EGR_03719 [Echinococcus granulosus]
MGTHAFTGICLNMFSFAQLTTYYTDGMMLYRVNILPPSVSSQYFQLNEFLEFIVHVIMIQFFLFISHFSRIKMSSLQAACLIDTKLQKTCKTFYYKLRTNYFVHLKTITLLCGVKFSQKSILCGNGTKMFWWSKELITMNCFILWLVTKRQPLYGVKKKRVSVKLSKNTCGCCHALANAFQFLTIFVVIAPFKICHDKGFCIKTLHFLSVLFEKNKHNNILSYEKILLEKQKRFLELYPMSILVD